MLNRLTVEELKQFNPNVYPYERKKLGTITIIDKKTKRSATHDFYEGDSILTYGKHKIILKLSNRQFADSEQIYECGKFVTYEERLGLSRSQIDMICENRNNKNKHNDLLSKKMSTNDVITARMNLSGVTVKENKSSSDSFDIDYK